MAGQNTNTTRNVLLIGLLLFVVVLFVWLLSEDGWMEHYRIDSREPYGLRLLVESLGGEDQLRIAKDEGPAALLDSTRSGGLYVFVGGYNYLDSANAEALIRFAERGNHVLIASEGISRDFLSHLFAVRRDSSFTEIFSDDWWEGEKDWEEEEWEDEDWDTEPDSTTTDSIPELRFDHEKGVIWHYHESIKLYQSALDSLITLEWPDSRGYPAKAEVVYRYQNKLLPNSWTSFDTDALPLSDVRTECIGKFNEKHCNLLKIEKGKGRIVMCSTPLVLTNYFLRNEDIAEIVQPLFPPAQTIIWDEYSRTFRFDPFDFESNDSYTEREGPLEFILRDRSLSWGWYVLMIGTVLYFIAGSRRKQRIIPIKDPNLNTSVEFAETMSRLYWKQADHRKIGLLKWQLFLIFVRDRYGMRLSETDMAANRKQLPLFVTKSGLQSDEINQIFEASEIIIATPKSTNENLVRLHASIERFYAKCK
jgi:hypothetical protein